MVNTCYFLYYRAILSLEGNLETKVFSDPPNYWTCQAHKGSCYPSSCVSWRRKQGC
ncbi:unnamed protein product [Musa acuminata subsp. burmannicoides]